MSSRPYKKRRITPKPVVDGPLVSSAAMKSTYNRLVTVEKKVRALQKDVELKCLDTTQNFNFRAVAAIPSTGQISLIPIGTDVHSRIGDKVTITSIRVKGTATLDPTTAADASVAMQLYVILDRQPNGAAATYADIFTDTNIFNALRNIQHTDRFQTLGVITLTCSPKAGVSGAYNIDSVPFDWYRKCKIPMQFSAGTGAITSISSNNIFLVQGTEGYNDNTVHCNGVARITYSDS